MKMLIDGKEYIDVETVRKEFIDKQIVKDSVIKFLESLGLRDPPQPEPAPKKGFFRR